MKIGIFEPNKERCEGVKNIIQDYAKSVLADVKIDLFLEENEIINHKKQMYLPEVLFLSMDAGGEKALQLAKEINEKFEECYIIFYSKDIENVTEVYKTEHLYFVLYDQLEWRMEEIFLKIFDKQRKAIKRYVFSVIGGKRVVLSENEILYLERVKRTTKIVSSIGVYEVRDKLDDLIKELPKQAFFRCHNSFIVYLPAVREVSKDSFVMENKDKVSISRSYMKAVKEIFG